MGQKDARAPQNNDSMRKPQQTSGTPAETYTKEMNMATDTENKEQAEIYERFCTNVANESRPSNQRKTRPKWIEKDQYPGADFDICNPYGTESNAQAPFKSNQAPFQGNQAPYGVGRRQRSEGGA
ncbi:hypothetical protein COL516b_007714 [Colletotrichum fioriniae]|nr:uncharacterized protein COL516b_007714 [Colletotrichum fioriniae]KAJ0301737.1 hypothetical protein COL516b_007714 [Colletotrichum fioriniae]